MCRMLIVAGLLAVVAAPALQAEIRMQNRLIELHLAPETANVIQRVTDRRSGRTFNAVSPAPLYTIEMVDGTRRRKQLDQTGHSAVSCRRSDQGDQLILTYAHDPLPITVEVSVRLAEDSGMSFWRCRVRNGTENAIVRVRFPGFRFAHAPVRGIERLVLPNAYSDLLVRDIRGLVGAVETEKGVTISKAHAPDVMGFFAYHDDVAGLFTAALDPEQHIIGVEATAYPRDSLGFEFDHLRPWRFGEDFEMEYDVTVGVFHGDWCDAAHIYKTWATKQRWCAVPLRDRDDIPAWTKSMPLFIRFNLEHPRLAEQPNDYSAIAWDAVLAALDNHPHKDVLSGAIVHLLYFSEGGSWQIYYGERWPAYFGDAHMANLCKELKKRDYHPGIQPNGWKIATSERAQGGRFFKPDGYDLARQPFWPELCAKQIVSFQHVEKGAAVTPPEHLKGKFTYLCVTEDYGKDVFAADARRTACWGLDYLQIMELGLSGLRNHCLNANHSHPVGRGKWVAQAVQDAFERARVAGKRINPDFTIDKEDTAAHLIPYTDFQYIRDCNFNIHLFVSEHAGKRKIGLRPFVTPIPLFDYVYHEYIPLITEIMWLNHINLFSDSLQRYAYARAITLGHSIAIGQVHEASRKYAALDKSDLWGMLANLQRLGVEERECLVFGKVLREPRVACAMIRHMDGRQGFHITTTPAIAASAHRLVDGSVGFCFVNAARTNEKLQFDLAPYMPNTTRKIPPPAWIRVNGRPVKLADVGALTGTQLELRLEKNDIALAMFPLP